MDLPSALLDAWVRAWSISRGTAEPAPVPDGWRVDVGLSGHRFRYVLHEPSDDRLARLGRDEGSPGAWVKIVGDPDRLHRALPSQWEPAETGHVMTIRLDAAPEVFPPAPYTLRRSESDGVLTAEVLDAEGRLAASAKLITVGTIAMFDQVETVPEHRRRGLGRLVMRVLAGHARDLGADTGLLAATDEGRHLYSSLGWTVRALLPAARVPEQ